MNSHRETPANLAVFVSFIFIIFGALVSVLVIFRPPPPQKSRAFSANPQAIAGRQASQSVQERLREQPSAQEKYLSPEEKLPEAPTTPVRAAVPPEKPAKNKQMVIVIDDVGHNLHQLEEFLKIDFPITFAILPDLPYSAKAAEKIRAAGKELILHQPMEALDNLNPGPHAIYISMKVEEIEDVIEANIKRYPGIVGMNNHMGSLATRYPEVIRPVLKMARKHGIFFLDSLTIEDSAVHTVAKQEGIKTWERDVFLDNIPDRDHYMKYIDDGMLISEKRGHAVMIGHVWSTDLAHLLMELYPHLVEAGYSLTTISRMMLDEANANTGN